VGHPNVTNGTPFAFEPLQLLDEECRPLLVALVKGTFAIGPDGRCARAEQQIGISLAGEARGEDPATSSFKYEPEVAFFKPATDVIMNGHAYATRSGTTETTVSLRVGPVQKQVRVSGERAWYRAAGKIGATRAAPFDKIPLTYERAFGGWDRGHADPDRHTCEPRNPVGVGYRASGIFEEQLRLPNLEAPDQPLRALGDRPPPAAFGFVSPHWQPRAALAGAYDERWQKQRAPLLPEGFDRRHCNAASPGLIAPGYLRGDEPVTVTGATPGGGTLSFNLPGLPPPAVRVVLKAGAAQRLVTNLDTVIIEPDERRVLMLWRTHLVLRSGPHDLIAIEVSPEAQASS
jgi:hypothetical protein